MYYIYVLKSAKTGRLYTGSTADLGRRVAQHNAGRSSATRSGTPYKLVYHEVVSTRPEATRRERYLKTGKGRTR